MLSTIITIFNRLKILYVLLITILHVSCAFAEDLKARGLSYDEFILSQNLEIYHCLLNINNPELNKGTFFASTSEFDYLLAFSVANPPGPILIIKSRQSNDLKNHVSGTYLVSKITSTCGENLDIEFLQVKQLYNGFVLTQPKHKVLLKLNIFSSINEGEFSQVDLKAKLYFDSESEAIAHFALLRASRYQLPAAIANTNCADKLNEMSAELCGLFATEMNPEMQQQCSLGMSGKLDDKIMRWKAYESSEKDELKLNKSRNEWLARNACPNTNTTK